MKKTLALASIVLMAASLGACGGGDDSSSGGSYCDQIKGLKSSVSDLDFTKLSEDQFSDLQNSLDDIEAAAPSDVKDDWGTLNDAIDQLQGILSGAGLSFDDLRAIQKDPNNLPDGVDIAELQDLAQKLNDFAANSDFKDASNAIQANVKDECDVDLDDSTSGS
jgi:hypothetical protein